MPNSPVVNFTLENNNIEVSTPQDGISHVMAMTTKGVPFDPSVVVKSLTQFQTLFGSEIVPDGSISNIETALKGGSKLRISRVLADDKAKGVVLASELVDDIITALPSEHNSIPIVIKTLKGYLFFSLTTKGYGDGLPDNPTIASTPNYSVVISQSPRNGSTSYDTVSLDVYGSLDSEALGKSLYSFKELAWLSNSTSSKYYFDVNSFINFVNNNGVFDVNFIYAKVGFLEGTATLADVTSIDQAYDVLANPDYFDGTCGFFDNSLLIKTNDVMYLKGNIGSAGTTPTVANWKAAYDALLDYEDAYQLTASHIHQHLESTDAIELHKYVRDSQEELAEVVYYIDVPKTLLGVALTDTAIQAWADNVIDTIGYSIYVAYFAGGYKYYSSRGLLISCDNIGTVLALGDTSASSYGPWLHFSGQNRGTVASAKGIVSPNYGSPSNYNKLNNIANHKVNMSVIRDIPGYGKQVMLVHNFTSGLKNDSFRFLGVVRLCLYIKKNLRPIINGFLEEPNTFSTWRRMYYKVNDVVEKLVSENAITNPVYVGDQTATSYSDLVYNTEAEVRQGKYKAKLSFKDVVALQEITFNMIVDSSTNTSTTTIE